MGLFNLIIIFVLGFALHCPAMCGPVVSVLYPDSKKAWRFHAGRVMGYSLLGLLAGKLGAYIYSIGFAALGLLAFIAIIVYLMNKTKAQFMPSQTLARFVPRPLLLGIMFSFIPCHYLWSMVGIAALSGSATLGMLLMATHAMMSAWGIHVFQNRMKGKGYEKWLLLASILILIFRISFHSPAEATSAPHSILNCF